MSLTNIKLPDLVIADLYRQSLVQDTEGEVVAREADAPAHVQKKGSVPEAEASANVQKTNPIPEQEAVSQPGGDAVGQQPPVKKPEKASTTQQPVQEQPVIKTTGAYKVLGNNKRNIAVVVHCSTEVFVPESDLQFLTKML